MISSYEVDPYKAQRFLRHLCLTHRKREESALANEELRQQIQHLKLSFKASAKPKDFQQAVRELESKIDTALEKQGKVVKHVYEGHDPVTKRIVALEKQIGAYLKNIEVRENRIKELEKKIKQREKKK